MTEGRAPLAAGTKVDVIIAGTRKLTDPVRTCFVS
jgi:hypothetical protein